MCTRTQGGRESVIAREERGEVHVLHLVFQLHPGGMEYGLLKPVNGLSGGPIRSAICSTRPSDPAMVRQLDRSVRLFELSRRPSGNDPLLIGRPYRLFQRERPGIVHTHAWGTLVEGLIAARLAGVPVVIHGEHGTLQSKSYQTHVQRWAWRRVDRLLSVSARLADKMSMVVGNPKVGHHGYSEWSRTRAIFIRVASGRPPGFRR